MSRERKPGDVHVVLTMHPSRVQEFASWLDNQCAQDSFGEKIAAQIKAQEHGRPLVVIDPEDREQVERLAESICGVFQSKSDSTYADGIQAALHLYSIPVPPKPDEPTGLGAVIEDADGNVWIRAARIAHGWHKPMNTWAKWSDIAAVKVLSPGVTA